MKEPRTPSAKKGGRRPKLSKKSSNTKLYADDHVTVGKLVGSWGKPESEVIRVIVSDWLRSNRVRAMGRDEAAEEVRGVYERVISEQVAPLARGIEELNKKLGALQGVDSSPAAGAKASAAAPAGEFRELIAGVRALVEQAAGDLSESSALQLERIERVARAQALTNALLGETFGAAWSTRDWLIRYLVEVDMLGRDQQPDDVEDALRKEKLVLRDEAGRTIGSLEDDLGVPDGLRITLSDALL